MNVLANDGISKAGIDALTNAGYNVITSKVEQENLVDYINAEKIEVLLVRSATTARKNLIDACPQLKLIGRGGVGMDNIDVEYARSIGRTIINTPAASSQSVAELVLGHMCAISRSLNDSYKQMESGDFKTLKKQYAKGVELRGKKLVIVGFGRIGQSLASYALGIGMDVSAVDMNSKPIELKLNLGNGIETKTVITPSSNMMEELKGADFISLHIPKQADGSAVLGAKEFAQMKDGVRIVNAARGGVINESDLINALNSGKIAGVALDVFENEPTPNQDLLAHPLIACTPHIGAATLEAQNRIGTELAEKIVAEFGQK
ncbi:MAG: NAD(P)-dependent oxidoreductase [Crocinitomicaceae bacterium]|nr:NAD(P)-dependent oxidoreductase [Crocinitomicaceae bacterium]